MLQYTILATYYGPLIHVIWENFNGKSIQCISSVLVSEGHCRLQGAWGPDATAVGIWPLYSGEVKMLISPVETSFGWDMGFFFNSVDIAVSLVTTLCYQSLMPFTLELPQVCPAERTSREIQACAYPYVQVIMCSATVSISILLPNTSCYKTMVLVVDNFARLLRIVFYMPVSCRF